MQGRFVDSTPGGGAKGRARSRKNLLTPGGGAGGERAVGAEHEPRAAAAARLLLPRRRRGERNCCKKRIVDSETRLEHVFPSFRRGTQSRFVIFTGVISNLEAVFDDPRAPVHTNEHPYLQTTNGSTSTSRCLPSRL